MGHLPGEHVCWLVRSSAEYDARERALLAGAASAGDGIMIVGERVRTRHHHPMATDVDMRVGPQLDCTGLELVDAAGWRALITAVAAVPGASLALEHVNDTVATTWRLSGYAESSIPVQVRK